MGLIVSFFKFLIKLRVVLLILFVIGMLAILLR